MRTPLTSSRPMLALLLLTALALRALTPVGWMPSHDLAAPMVICTGHGAMTKAPPSDRFPAPDARSHHEACAFSGLGFAPAPDAVPLVRTAVHWTPAPQADAPATPALVSRGWRPQFARPPPILA